MMKTLTIAAALSLALARAAIADVALILNDKERSDLTYALDAAVRAQGLQVAPQMLHLLQRLNAAPVVTEQKSTPTEPNKDAPK